MNKAFDYNGVQISASRPVQKLVKRTRILHLDSGDRDTNLFKRNGNLTIYLPRAYERVTSINIKDAEFPKTATSDVARTWTGSEEAGTGAALSVQPNYFFLEVRGLNMSDETAPAADRSASTNSVFAKFVVANSADPLVIYNESSNAHQNIEFFPALTKLDRFQFKLRTHTMSSDQYLYWSAGEWSMSLEIESLENAFDEFSTMETRLGERS